MDKTKEEPLKEELEPPQSAVSLSHTESCILQLITPSASQAGIVWVHGVSARGVSRGESGGKVVKIHYCCFVQNKHKQYHIN